MPLAKGDLEARVAILEKQVRALKEEIARLERRQGQTEQDAQLIRIPS